MKALPQISREDIMDNISYENLWYLMATIPPYRGLDEYEDQKKPGTASNKLPAKKHKEIKHFNQFGF